MPSTIRTRSNWSVKHYGNRKVWSSSGPLVSDVNSSFPAGSVERVTSSPTAWFAHNRQMKRDPFYRSLYKNRDEGSSYFLVQRTGVSIASPWVRPERYTGTALVERYDGRLATLFTSTNPTSPTLPTPIFPLTLEAMGTKGWNKFKPTQSQIGMGQFVGELHDAPFSLKRLRELKDLVQTGLIDLPKATSKGYLAYEFGWRPLVNDLRALARQILDFDKRIQQLARDNGRAVRRKGVIDVTGSDTMSTATSSTGGGYSWPPLHTSMYLAPEVRQTRDVTSSRYGFAGRFAYFIGRNRYGYTPLDTRRRYQLNRLLFGIDPTDLHTAYQLMPWSWLVDWALPVGPIIQNLLNDPVDNLVAHYAYVTGHKSTQHIETVTGRFSSGPYTIVRTVFSETKERRRATPYGFGLLDTGFSLRQLAILAALGVSRA